METKNFTAGQRDEIYRQCLDTYGETAQTDMAIEEMAELTHAIMKLRRSGDTHGKGIPRTNFTEEMADVKIMIRQLEILYGCEEEVEDWINFKVERQIGRMKMMGMDAKMQRD